MGNALRARLEENHQSLLTGSYSEQDVVTSLVLPVLEHLGYTMSNRRQEHHVGSKTVDIALWADSADRERHRPSVIVEVKKPGANFDKSSSRARTPIRQLEGYMVSNDSSQEVFGVLTDGVVWRVLKRTGPQSVARLGEWDVLENRLAVSQIKKHIGCGEVTVDTRSTSTRSSSAEVLDGIFRGDGPSLFFERLGCSGEIHDSVGSDTHTALAARDDWETVRWTLGPALTDGQDSDGESGSVVIGYAQVKSLARDDMHLLLRTLSGRNPGKVAVVVAFVRKAGEVAARIGVHRAGRTSIGAEFDAGVPNPTATVVMGRFCQFVGRRDVEEQSVEGVVSNVDVHKSFFDEIRKWMAHRIQDKDKQERTSILRHLLRCVFVWTINDRIGFKGDVFERHWWKVVCGGSYHKQFIQFLFHGRLNKRCGRGRKPHENDKVDAALKGVRYLNGSLFAKQRGDKKLHLRDEDYFGHDTDKPGLWTIFQQYNWTTREEDAEVREQSIDPKMLGGLFENLIAVVETGSTENLLKAMPDGTYYTPADVVWEMSKDAVKERLLSSDLPAGWDRAAVDALFDDGEVPEGGREAVAELLSGFTVFDPAVGSGEFLLGTTRVIRKGIVRLVGRESPLARTRRIVERQMHGQDLNPLAVGIARLRLFIAIEDDETGMPGRRPLPNLDAKIVCANTIGTEIRRGGKQSLGSSDPEVLAAVVECHGIQDEFLRAHGKQKERLRDKRLEVGQKLLQALNRVGDTHGSLAAFAAHDYLNHDNDEPVMTDPRWTFGRQGDGGFDIVIGNPPYVRKAIMGREKWDELVRHAARNGFHRFDDIYMAFLEAGLELAKPEGGVVQFVVPLSLTFANSKSELRTMYRDACSKIWLRHQDIRPSPLFGESPTTSNANGQRTTIVLGIRGDQQSHVFTTGLGRFSKSKRHHYLQSRMYVPWSEASILSRLHTECQGQWPRVATSEGVEIIQQAVLRGGQVAWRGTVEIGWPKTACRYVTAAPAGLLGRRESVVRCAENEMDGLLAILNSGTVYLWWKAWDDGFDVKPVVPCSFPDVRGLLDRDALDDLGKDVRRHLVEGPKKTMTSGIKSTETENINLWETCGDVLVEVDRLILAGLGLEGGEYLEALAVERSPYILDAQAIGTAGGDALRLLEEANGS